jgi:hypothetical protein
MRHNGRPPVLVSALPPDQVNLRPGEPVAMRCRLCGKWRVKRKMLWLHRAHDGVSRCPGSGQRVDLDLAPAQWLARLEAARRSAHRPVSLQRAAERAFRQARAAERAASGWPA